MVDPFINLYDDKYAVERVRRAVQLLNSKLPGDSIVLDLGCHKQEARKWLNKDFKYIGIDTTKYSNDTVEWDLNRGSMPIPHTGFICLETLEHLQDPAHLLTTAFNTMNKEGWAVVSLPNESTLFHRLRGLMGTMDAECFSGSGKHLHLPSLRQCRKFLRKYAIISEEHYYINPSATGSRQEWLGALLMMLPDAFHQFLANLLPSLFARGFIFLLRNPSGGRTHA